MSDKAKKSTEKRIFTNQTVKSCFTKIFCLKNMLSFQMIKLKNGRKTLKNWWFSSRLSIHQRLDLLKLI